MTIHPQQTWQQFVDEGKIRDAAREHNGGTIGMNGEPAEPKDMKQRELRRELKQDDVFAHESWSDREKKKESLEPREGFGI